MKATTMDVIRELFDYTLDVAIDYWPNDRVDQLKRAAEDFASSMPMQRSTVDMIREMFDSHIGYLIDDEQYDVCDRFKEAFDDFERSVASK